MNLKPLAAIAATISMACAMETSTPEIATLTALTDANQTEDKGPNLYSKEAMGWLYDVVKAQVPNFDDIKGDIECLEIKFDGREATKLDPSTFEDRKQDVEDFFHRLKEYLENPENEKYQGIYKPFIKHHCLSSFDLVTHCNEVLARGVTINDFVLLHPKVTYRVRGETAELKKLDELFGHYAKGEWMQIALFQNMPTIEKLDLTNFLKKHELTFDGVLRQLLYTKCPNLKSLEYCEWK